MDAFIWQILSVRRLEAILIKKERIHAKNLKFKCQYFLCHAGCTFIIAICWLRSDCNSTVFMNY
jgi:hypothetical protein